MTSHSRDGPWHPAGLKAGWLFDRWRLVDHETAGHSGPGAGLG